MSLAVRTLTDRYPNAPIIIVAVSLGGYVDTKFVQCIVCTMYGVYNVLCVQCIMCTMYCV